MKKTLYALLAATLCLVLANVASAQIFKRYVYPAQTYVASYDTYYVAAPARQLPANAKTFTITTTNLNEWARILDAADRMVPQNSPAAISWEDLNVVLSYLDPSGQIKIPDSAGLSGG